MKIAFLQGGSATRKTNQKAFGWELLMDFHGCDPVLLSDEKKIQQCAEALCALLDETPRGIPMISRSDAGFKPELSLVLFTTRGAITGHFSAPNGSAYINVFSTEIYDPDPVEQFTRSHLGADRMSSRFIIRR